MNSPYLVARIPVQLQPTCVAQDIKVKFRKVMQRIDGVRERK
jgi:hypothetical protein